MSALALVADVGGTHCRMALVQGGDAYPHLRKLRVVATPRGDLRDCFRAYLESADCGRPDVIAIAAAGRVHRGESGASVSLTNAGLIVDQTSLTHFACERTLLLNDLAAVAAAIPLLRPQELDQIGSAIAQPSSHKLVLGVGTGLGAALLTAGGELIETEAGHVDLAAVTASERDLLLRLSPQARISVEQLLSGPGLLRLYALLASLDGPQLPGFVQALEAAQPAALETMEIFSRWLGRVAGNLVLSLGAWGGVYFAGGVIRGLGPHLNGEALRQGLEDKAPFGADMRKVATRRILHEQPALLGLAQLCFRADAAASPAAIHS